MIKESLIDTGFLFATLDKNDPHHEKCSRAYEKEFYPLLPDVVLPELAYVTLRELEVRDLAAFLRSVANNDFVIERTTNEDLKRAAEILEQYD